MTPSEIAELEFKLKAAMYQIEACDEQIERQAAAIIELEAKLEQATEALIAEQFSAEQGERLFRAEQAKLEIATEALEAAEDKHLRGLINMTVEEIDRVHELRRQALARIKEV